MELAASPSIVMNRASITVAGIAADAPHMCGEPLKLRSTLIRENEFHQMKESAGVRSIISLTNESFSPYGWIAALPSASNTKAAERAVGRAKIRRRATPKSGGPDWPAAR